MIFYNLRSKWKDKTVLCITWNPADGGGSRVTVKSRKISIYLAPSLVDIHSVELGMLSGMSQVLECCDGSTDLPSQASIMLSFVSFVLLFSIQACFCHYWRYYLCSLIFLSQVGFYLVFLDFCWVGFPVHNTPLTYWSEATWQLLVDCSTIYIYTIDFWIA